MRRKGHPEYCVWQSMKARCNNPNNPFYARYGGRGITVCERWQNSFDHFLADLGKRPTPAHQLERIDNEQGYHPANCRWATRKEQANNRSNNRLIEHQGQRLTLSGWAAKLNRHASTIKERLNRGCSVEESLFGELVWAKTAGATAGNYKNRRVERGICRDCPRPVDVSRSRSRCTKCLDKLKPGTPKLSSKGQPGLHSLTPSE